MRALSVVLMMVVAGSSVGCKKVKERLAEKAAEKMVEAATGGKVDVESGQGTVTYKNEDGTVATVHGGNAKVPDGWPQDVPLYTPGVLKSSMGVSDKGSKMHFTLAYEINEPAQQVVEFYAKGLSGYKKTSELNANDASIVSFEGNGKVVGITVTSPKGQDKGSLSVIVSNRS